MRVKKQQKANDYSVIINAKKSDFDPKENNIPDNQYQ
jgi:hypothetical protein